MDVEEVMKLFDFCWFEREILKKRGNSSSSSASEANSDRPVQGTPSKPEIETPSKPETITRTRSMSEELSSRTSCISGALSPDSGFPNAKLHTILSGKEMTESEEPKVTYFEASSKKKITSSRRRKRGESKSLSELEFEELKGFMDLGFVFSDEDRCSSLASILPGLNRFGKKDVEVEAIEESAIPRPYLSEAWEVLDRKKAEDPLMNWKIPALSNENTMKDNLRMWAQTVASTVRCQ